MKSTISKISTQWILTINLFKGESNRRTEFKEGEELNFHGLQSHRLLNHWVEIKVK